MIIRGYLRLLILSCILIMLGMTAGGSLKPALASGSKLRPFSIEGIAQVRLRSDNFAAARRFYTHVLGFDEMLNLNEPDSGGATSVFKVNDHQYIELSRGQHQPERDLRLQIVFQTANAEALHHYLASRNVPNLGQVRRTLAGNLGFRVRDPEGHSFGFVEYMPGSRFNRYLGKDMPSSRISTKIIHAGFIVHNRAQEDRFFRDLLGFRLMWYGGMTDQATDWVDMRVPDGANWIEYMLRVRHPSLHALGVMYHFSLGVPSVARAYKIAMKRGYHAPKPQIGRDGKWQLNLYDPDGTRVELMEPKPVRTPCCSPMRLGTAGSAN
ncbi:MAG: VOC family protein [Terriglobia bacterium]